MEKKIIVYNELEIEDLAHQLAGHMKNCKIFAFTGPLGAGKTTLIARILAQYGVTQTVTSPTFTYLNVYENDKGQLFYHFDLYRIATLHDFVAAGFDEYLYAPNSWCFIEWPAVIMPLLKEKVCLCEIDYYDKQRKITLQTS